MTELRGMPVVTAIKESLSGDIEKLKNNGIMPCIAVVRVGAREDDLSYERGIMKRFGDAGAEVRTVGLPETCTQEELDNAVFALNDDVSVHGILLFRPLPRHLTDENITAKINPLKDIDCMGKINTALVFEASGEGYPPCTAQAVIELIDYNKIDLTGKRVVIVGRSMVVGKPLAMLMLAKNATVTVCHTRTKNLAGECKNADIIVACAGVARMITAGYVSVGQVVIDVGINIVDGKLCGDVDYDCVAPIVDAATPVPGGVGTITTSVLLKHTVNSALYTAP